MSLASSQVAVGITPTLVTSVVRIKNCSTAGTTVYVGGSTVSPTTGYPLAVDDELYFTGDGTTYELHAVVASGTGVVAVLDA